VPKRRRGGRSGLAVTPPRRCGRADGRPGGASRRALAPGAAAAPAHRLRPPAVWARHPRARRPHPQQGTTSPAPLSSRSVTKARAASSLAALLLRHEGIRDLLHARRRRDERHCRATAHLRARRTGGNRAGARVRRGAARGAPLAVGVWRCAGWHQLLGASASDRPSDCAAARPHPPRAPACASRRSRAWGPRGLPREGRGGRGAQGWAAGRVVPAAAAPPAGALRPPAPHASCGRWGTAAPAPRRRPAPLPPATRARTSQVLHRVVQHHVQKLVIALEDARH
jgi:hypothetical protein